MLMARSDVGISYKHYRADPMVVSSQTWEKSGLDWKSPINAPEASATVTWTLVWTAVLADAWIGPTRPRLGQRLRSAVETEACVIFRPGDLANIRTALP